MSLVLVSDTYLSDIADAIREKLGVATTYKPSEMAAAIMTISGGGTVTLNGVPYSSVSYSGQTSGSATLDSSGTASLVLSGGTYTFVNTVTIDGIGYTAYTKTAAVAGDSTTVNLFPAGALYWYGRSSTNFADAGSYTPPGSSTWGQNIAMTAGTNCISGTAETSSGTHRDVMWGSAAKIDTTGYTYLKARLIVDWSATNSTQNNVALKSTKSFTANTVKTVNLGSAEYDGFSDINIMSVTDAQGENYLCGNAGSTYNSGAVSVTMKILALWLE